MKTLIFTILLISTATYVVDSYGDRNTVELFDWDKEI